jgi:hypothetical protein
MAMLALRLFWKGVGHLWIMAKARVAAALFPLSSFSRMVATLVVATLVGLAIVAFVLAWLFLALVTSAAEARAIALLALSITLMAMACVVIFLSAQAMAARLFCARRPPSSQPRPNPFPTTSLLLAIAVGCLCLATQGLDKGAVLSIQIAAGAMITSLLVLLMRLLCVTPEAVRSVQKIGFDRLSAHQKLHVIAARADHTKG